MIGDIARFACERQLPSIFERGWYNHTAGANVVALATRMIEDEEKRKRNRTVFLLFLIVFSAALMSLNVLKIYMSDNIFDVSLLVIQSGLLLVAAALSFALYLSRHPVDESDEATVNRFCEYLGKLCFWSPGIESMGVNDISGLKSLEKLSDDEIREHGTAILAECVCSILESQALESPKSLEEKGKRGITEGHLHEEFNHRYHVLNSIGLVSGPYDKYYEAGRKMLEEKKKQPKKQELSSYT